MGLFDFLKKGEQKPANPVKPGTPHGGMADPIQQSRPAQPQAAANMDTYTVKSGDSLSKIAKNFYGDAMQWRKIHEANKDKISNPDMIQPGWVLKIPKQ
ncbi:LysM peptidoglycan-binding domain-containing protein [Adhaeribacter soli]|uniref:LysM peptidoglycan-binding domain-containing protein n=1 Tax=Adhaeribacter soli TaxID=2607655 RepID=A0A5N1JAL5_9BACT|nr:LysM peptidoglycan-binding domain-containing protein [Adhaeribacter soli]KAA9346058.1 LysM peptidoglycan-binding domain-containing protein [Adhaeribacter soli]